jgi:hypothetical protein
MQRPSPIHREGKTLRDPNSQSKAQDELDRNSIKGDLTGLAGRIE